MVRHALNIFAFFLLSLVLSIFIPAVAANSGSQAPYNSQGGDSTYLTAVPQGTSLTQSISTTKFYIARLKKRSKKPAGASSTPEASSTPDTGSTPDTSSTQGTFIQTASPHQRYKGKIPPGNTSCEKGNPLSQIPSCQSGYDYSEIGNITSRKNGCKDDTHWLRCEVKKVGNYWHHAGYGDYWNNFPCFEVVNTRVACVASPQEPPGNTECEFGYKHNEEREKIPSCMTECLKKFSADICQKLNAGITNRIRSVHACKQGEDYFVGCHTAMVGRYWKFHSYFNYQLEKQINSWKRNYCEAKHITLYPCNPNEMPETPPGCGYQCKKCSYMGDWYEAYQCVAQCNQCREQYFLSSDDNGSQPEQNVQNLDTGGHQ